MPILTLAFFFFKQKTAYEIGLGIPAEPLFRSVDCWRKMRKFDLSLRSSRSSYFATFRHQLTILSKTDALDEEKWLNMLGTFFRCCHLKNIWTAPLPPETELSRQMTTSTTSIDIMGLQAAYANLHTDQERDYFMQRYHDVISSFGGKTSYDADNRPLLVMRSNLWA